MKTDNLKSLIWWNKNNHLLLAALRFSLKYLFIFSLIRLFVLVKNILFKYFYIADLCWRILFISLRNYDLMIPLSQILWSKVQQLRDIFYSIIYGTSLPRPSLLDGGIERFMLIIIVIIIPPPSCTVVWAYMGFHLEVDYQPKELWREVANKLQNLFHFVLVWFFGERKGWIMHFALFSPPLTGQSMGLELFYVLI